MRDKIVVITGVSSGIGLALLQYFKNIENVKAIIGISRNIDPIHPIIKSIPNNLEIELISTDLAKPHFSDVIKPVLKKYNKIDILINNAGTLLHESFENSSQELWEKTFQINVFAAVEMIQLSLPQLKKSNLANVINISSMGGFQGSVKFPGLSAYSASKAAIANLTECLAQEYSETSIRFNAFALGAVETPMLKKAFPDYKSSLSPERIADFIGDFAIKNDFLLNGKILPVSCTTP